LTLGASQTLGAKPLNVRKA